MILPNFHKSTFCRLLDPQYTIFLIYDYEEGCGFHLQLHTFEFGIAVRIANSNLQRCRVLREGNYGRINRIGCAQAKRTKHKKTAIKGKSIHKTLFPL